MDIYNAWFDLKPGVSDMEFSERLAAYMDSLKNEGLMQGWRLTRRKLGLSAAPVGEFHLMMEFTGMAQLDQAFGRVRSRRAPIETAPFRVNSLGPNVPVPPYRDFPGRRRPAGPLGGAATGGEPIESVHFGVNSLVQNVQFALYRDFPDEGRHRGEEKF